ncbi:hypothetical protein [Nostoc sp. CALU 546]|uniref:hypothetical protein n=1 Tax=Nostoc sp. CALU 546 TaxID=1867241 RepID=UPI003B67AD73
MISAKSQHGSVSAKNLEMCSAIALGIFWKKSKLSSTVILRTTLAKILRNGPYAKSASFPTLSDLSAGGVSNKSASSIVYLHPNDLSYKNCNICNI